MKVTVATVMPQSIRGKAEYANLETALKSIKLAAEKGAKIISLPEGFPGPYNGPFNWDPAPEITAAAREYGVYVVFGTLTRLGKGSNHYYLTLKVAGPSGEIVQDYHRMQPNQPEVDDILMDGKKIVRGEEFALFDTEYGKIGLLICSEIWCPELSRILALKGADIIFAPIGGLVYELREAWRCLLWARAIENHVYIATSQHLYGMEDGIGLIAGPEKILAERKDAGLVIAELDLARLKWLRENDQTLELPKQYKSIPGMLKYRRPEKYGTITEPDGRVYQFPTHD